MHKRTSTGHLDGIRGLAARIVLLGHASNFGIHIIPGLDLRSTAKAGVWLFFILSAYLLTRRLRDDMRQAAMPALKAYLIKRGFRILPLYFLVLLFCVLLGWMTPVQALAHTVLAEGRAHLWTIVVEMTFYAALPLGVIFLRTTRQYCFFFVASVLISLLSGFDKIPANSLALGPYMAFFGAGMLLSVAPTSKMKSTLATACCVAALISVVTISPRTIAFLSGVTIEHALAFSYAHILPWSAIIALSGQSGPFRKLFGSAPFRAAGNLSFAAYLIHYPMFELIAASPLTSIPLIGAISLFVVAIVAAILFTTVERPLLKRASDLADQQHAGRRCR